MKAALILELALIKDETELSTSQNNIHKSRIQFKITQYKKEPGKAALKGSDNGANPETT